MNAFDCWPPAQYQVLKNWIMYTCTQMGCIPQDRGAIACIFSRDTALERSFALQGAQTQWFISLKIFNSKSYFFFFSFSIITNWSVRVQVFLVILTKVTQITKELLLNLFPNQQILETLMFGKPCAGSGNRQQNEPLSSASIPRKMMSHIFQLFHERFPWFCPINEVKLCLISRLNLGLNRII